VLCVPELIGGLVFGAGFAAVRKGRRLAGAISGAILSSLVPLAFAISDAAHYLQVKPSMEPPSPDWKREYISRMTLSFLQHG